MPYRILNEPASGASSSSSAAPPPFAPPRPGGSLFANLLGEALGMQGGGVNAEPLLNRLLGYGLTLGLSDS